MFLSQGDLKVRLPMMRGEEVRRAQLALKRSGDLTDAADGVFGPRTRDAVISFQTKLHARNPHIEVDGIVGRDTWSALFPEDAAVIPAADIAAPPSLERQAVGDLMGWVGRFKPLVAPGNLGSMHGPPIGNGSKRWMLALDGIRFSETGSAPRSSGEPQTATRVWGNFRTPLEKCAAAYGVPVELLIATACTESGGDPRKIREEPNFVSDTETPGQVSPGLMQTLISTARAATGDNTLDREKLCDPEVSIRAGAAYIAQQATDRRHTPSRFDPPLVAIAYNAGSLRAVVPGTPAAVPENTWGLVQTARPPGMHADVFVEFFNDAFAVLSGAPPNANTPSFFMLMKPS